MKLKYFVGFLIVIGALVYLLATTFRSSLQYYVTVSELKAKVNLYQEKTLKVAGRAQNVKNLGLSLHQFDIVEGGVSLPTKYEGFLPDTFKEGAEVVATGKPGADGIFVATEILAKCASKYEAKLK